MSISTFKSIPPNYIILLSILINHNDTIFYFKDLRLSGLSEHWICNLRGHGKQIALLCHCFTFVNP